MLRRVSRLLIESVEESLVLTQTFHIGFVVREVVAVHIYKWGSVG